MSHSSSWLGTRLLASALVALAGPATAQTPDTTGAVATWVRANALPLDTVDPEADRADLRPLLPLLGPARVVAVGESTHGTRDFFQFKDRLWRFLVEEAGYRAFAMEAGFAAGQAADAYVTRGEGTVQHVLEELRIPVWNTDEVAALLDWTRDYNANAPEARRVRFFGIDARNDSLELAGLAALLGDVTNPEAPALLARADSLRRFLWLGYRHADGAERAAIDSALADIGDLIDRVPPDELRPEDRRTARRHLAILGSIRDQSRVLAEAQPEVLSSGYNHLRARVVPAADSLRQFLHAHDPALPGRLDRFLGSFLGARDLLYTTTRQSFEREFADQHWDALAHALHAHVYVMQNRHRSRGATAAEVERARLWASDLALYTRTVREYTQIPSPRPNPRDAMMAENVRWVLETLGPDARVMLWAHNWHVTTKPMAPGTGRMGTHLAEALGDEYVAVGFAFDRGQFRAGDRRPGAEPGSHAAMAVGPAKEGSIDAVLAGAGLPLFALDLRAVPASGPVAAWMAAPHPLRDVGASFLPSGEDGYYLDTALLDDYDAIVFVGETSASRRQ